MTRKVRTGERGQTSAEYLGVLLLVAVIVGAVLMLSGLDRSIVEGMRTAICRIAGGDCRPTGQAATLTVEGHVRGCRFDGQLVALAGPELVVRPDGGEEGTQAVELGAQIELVAPRAAEC